MARPEALERIVRPIAPRIDGADEITIAEHQLEYMPITACLVQFSDGDVQRVCRWTFTPEERARIAAGEDIYFGTPASIKLTPHWLKVGFP
jgi:hypothetical protein